MYMDSASWSVKMIADASSLSLMQEISEQIGATIEIIAKSGGRYSYRGGEGTSIVPKGSCFVCINAGNKIKTFWDLVSKEKTKRHLVWLAANPVQG